MAASPCQPAWTHALGTPSSALRLRGNVSKHTQLILLFGKRPTGMSGEKVFLSCSRVKSRQFFFTSPPPLFPPKNDS